MKTIIFALLLLSSGCVTKAQYRSLAESYKAYHEQTSEVYLKVYDEAPQSVKVAKRHDIEAAKQAFTSALELAK